MNILKHASRVGFGHYGLDGIAYFENFPHHPRPFDFQVHKNDECTFAFVVYQEEGKIFVALRETDCSHESLLTAYSINENDVIMCGRGWPNARCIYIDKRELELKNYFELESFLNKKLGLDISNWRLFGGSLEAIVPLSAYNYELKKLNKKMQRLQLFLERLLISREAYEEFVTNSSRNFDYEQIKNTVYFYMNEYSLFTAYSKTHRTLHEDLNILCNLNQQLAKLAAIKAEQNQ